MAGGGEFPVRESFRGAKFGITEHCGTVNHDDGCRSKPVLLRSYKDGIRIGCTFVSNAALRRIWDLHQSFLGCADSREHQAGSGL